VKEDEGGVELAEELEGGEVGDELADADDDGDVGDADDGVQTEPGWVGHALEQLDSRSSLPP
jgi:hypothetical protein